MSTESDPAAAAATGGEATPTHAAADGGAGGTPISAAAGGGAQDADSDDVVYVQPSLFDAIASGAEGMLRRRLPVLLAAFFENPHSGVWSELERITQPAGGVIDQMHRESTQGIACSKAVLDVLLGELRIAENSKSRVGTNRKRRGVDENAVIDVLTPLIVGTLRTRARCAWESWLAYAPFGLSESNLADRTLAMAMNARSGSLLTISCARRSFVSICCSASSGRGCGRYNAMKELCAAVRAHAEFTDAVSFLCIVVTDVLGDRVAMRPTDALQWIDEVPTMAIVIIERSPVSAAGERTVKIVLVRNDVVTETTNTVRCASAAARPKRVREIGCAHAAVPGDTVADGDDAVADALF